MNLYIFCRVEMYKNRCTSERVFQRGKGDFLSLTPCKRDIFLDESIQWSRYLRKSFDESAIVRAQSKKTSDCFQVRWRREVGDGLNFGRIRFDPTTIYPNTLTRDFRK